MWREASGMGDGRVVMAALDVPCVFMWGKPWRIAVRGYILRLGDSPVVAVLFPSFTGSMYLVFPGLGAMSCIDGAIDCT